jgi:hypothetical protein
MFMIYGWRMSFLHWICGAFLACGYIVFDSWQVHAQRERGGKGGMERDSVEWGVGGRMMDYERDGRIMKDILCDSQKTAIRRLGRSRLGRRRRIGKESGVNTARETGF